MAIFVHTLAVTEHVCMNKTIGHMNHGNTHLCSRALVKENGMQNNAMIRSEMARLIRNPRRSVRERFPHENTIITSVLPTMDNTMAMVYRMMNTNLGSCGSFAALVAFVLALPKSYRTVELGRVATTEVVVRGVDDMIS